MKRFLSLFLAAVMIFSMLPTSAFAASPDLGTVHVIVQNSNAPTDDLRYWTDGTAPWKGVRVEIDVPLKQDSSISTCIDDAIRSLGEEHYVVGADVGTITEIDGLKSGVGYSGWMVTLNDWFTSEGVGEFTYANGKLEAGDVICADYTLTGSDLGGSWENNKKTLKSVSVSGAELAGRFSSAKKEYDLTLAEGQKSGNVTITPTASNKNFQVRVYKGETYNADQKGIKRNTAIPVAVNDTLWVVVGDPTWPSMNDAGLVPAGVYKFHIVEKSSKPTVGFDDFFKSLEGVARVQNDTQYPFMIDVEKGALQSTNQAQGNSESAITLTFEKAANLSFQYQCSTERASYGNTIFDKFLVKVDGTRKLLDGGIQDNFQSYSLNVPAGSTVTLSYEKDYSGDKGDDCVWLKDFAAETLSTVTFPNMPQGAKITVKKGGEIVEGNADGKSWTMTAGDYTYSASCFGFEPVTDVSFKVGKTDLAVEGGLKRLTSAKVTFTLNPQNAKLTVTQGENTLTAEDDGSYLLPVSETPYHYEVTAVGYTSKTDEVTVSSDVAQTITVSLTRGTGWDGTTKEPSKNGEVYQIGTAAELAWFAQQVNNGNAAIQGVLTSNVKLSDSDVLNTNWTPIGTDKTPFTGKFDGQGHSVDNLYIHDAPKDAQKQGLFGVIGKGGSVHNLILENPYVDSKSTIGAVAGKCSGILSKCAVRGGQLTSGDGHAVGGVVGYNDGTVEMCLNTANVLNPNSASGDYTAGIVGENHGKILDCYNMGTIKGYKVAGIAGWGSNSGTDATIENCYNGGKLDASTWNVYHISGYSSRTNCYYINTNSSNNSDSYSSAVAEDAVKTLSNALGGAFENREDGSLHLLWENPATTYTITITAVPEEAEVTLTKAGQVQNGTEMNGVHTFSKLAAGTYKYTVSYESGDCKPQEAEIVVDGRNVSVNVELEAQKYDVVFKLEPKDAVLTLKQGEKVVEGGVVDNNAGTVTYHLPNGTYTYHAEKFGYTPAEGEIVVNKAAVSKDVLLTKANGAYVTFDITPSEGKSFYDGDPKITVTIGEHTESPSNKEKLYLPSGEYAYTIQAATFTTIEGTLTVESKDQTVTKSMQYSSVWDGQTSIEPKLVDDVYQITNGYELAWFRDLVNTKTDNGKSCNAKAIVMDNIDLGGHDWVPIGHDNSTNWSGPDYGYTGNFNGNGKTISGLLVQMDGQKRAGLFGTVTTKAWGDGKGDGSIHDLTVEGSVKGNQYLGGIAANVMGQKVQIRNCTANVTVTAKDGYAGGVVGYLKDGAKVENCTNLGAITAERSTGGIVGNASKGLAVENCCNKGTITASGGQNGGVVGNSSKTPIQNCVNHGSVTSTGNQIGGIVGFTNSTVEYCYNTGAITGKSNTKNGVGGVVGKLNYTGSSLINSYNAGTVTDAEGGNGTIGALVGNKSENGIVVGNCYYLETSCAQGVGGEKHDEADQFTACTAQQLESLRMAAMLGGNFAAPQNAGYPILGFESADARYITFFDVTPNDAVVKIESVTAAEPGVYVLTSGSYKYTVSKAGYGTVTGTVDAGNNSQLIPVTLNEETFTVTFRVTPKDAVITVKNEEGQVQNAGDNGYALSKGNYTYTVEKFGYETESGSFTVESSNLVLDPITLKEAAKYAVNLEISYGAAPAETTVQIFCGENQVGDSASLNLPNGKYTYKVVASGYFNAEGDFTVDGKTITVKVKMDVRNTWDGSKSEPKKVEGIYQITCAEELAWLAENINSGAISINSNAMLLADIVLNDEKSTNKWTPIGNYDHQYAGIFDGNGKAVKGLNDALFGYGGEGGLIKNVTVYGKVTGDSNRGGICTASGGSFENCVNYAQVSATKQRIGGIVGVLYNSGSIKNCVNYGDISTTFKAPVVAGYYAHIGGVVGYAYGPVEGSVNHGTVTAQQKTDGGIGGVVGETLSTVTNCYNTGAVTGCTKTGGVAGTADRAGTKLENCYNVGQIRATDEYPNPNVGAVVGDIGNADGGTVAQIINCYYLENSYHHDHHGTIHNGGVGYGTDSTVKKTEQEMKAGAFALSLGDGYNADNDIPINNGFPVLKWQGGKAPVTSEDQQAVAADKLALDVTPTTVTEAMTLNLTKTGSQGSTITWNSSNTAVISNAGVVTLPADGIEQVTLTATITKGTASDTRDFVIVVQSKKLVEQTALNELVKVMGGVRLKPVFGKDTNITAVMQEYVNAVAAEKMPAMALSKLSVTLTAVGSNANQADQESHIAKDGTISYFYQDPASAIMNGSVVKDIGFKISYGDAEKDCTTMANIPWHADKVRKAMGAIADALTFDVIKGENTDANAVSKNLTLPVRLEDYGWSLIDWDSSNAAVTIEPGVGNFAPYTGVVYPEQEDTAVTLTATITFNRTVQGEPAISVTKEIPVTIPGSISQIDSILEMALDKYTMDKLTDSRTGEVINPKAVTGDVSLLSPRKLGIDGRDYSVVVTAENDGIVVNGYRANVYRPLPDAEAVEIPLTVTITHKNTGKAQSKKLGTVTVLPLKQSEIDEEVALMERVKESFFEGIRKDNADVAHITGDLCNFQEVYEKNGELVWVYSYQDRTDVGIVPTSIPKKGYDESYNLFHSSQPTIIQHENLLLKRIPDANTQVTITACLGSQEYGRYAERYPENEQLQKLVGQMVSVTVTVLGNGEDQKKANDVEALIDAIGTVTLESEPAIKAAREAYEALTQNQKDLVSPERLNTLRLAEKTLALLKQPKPEVEKIYRTTGDYLEGILKNVPVAGSEWGVLDLVRSGREIPAVYYGNVVAYIEKNINADGQLSRATDNARMILTLTAMGKDVTDVAGHNLLQGLADMKYVTNQGINGPIWTLMAFDSHAYEVPNAPEGAEQVTREKLLTCILEAQLDDNGWSFGGNKADADMTAMAIQALAPYYKTNSDVKAAVDKALTMLSETQNAVGGFGSIDGASSESCAQVIIALTALGIDPANDTRFVKNGKSVVDALCSYALDGGFSHIPGGEVNNMATEQSYRGLTAYFRFINGATALFDMKDVKIDKPVDPVDPSKPTEPTEPVEPNKPEHTHVYTWFITHMPTETLPGEMEGRCSCGQVMQKMIPVVGVCGNMTVESNDENACDGKLVSDDVLYKIPLSDEEAQALVSGTDLKITLEISDISGTISDVEKKAIKHTADQKTVGMYLNVVLFKQIGDGEKVAVHNIGDKIKVSIVVPENLRSKDRTYQIIRLHDSKTEVVSCTYDGKTGTLVFETDQISVYALAYKDAKDTTPNKPNSPATDDESNAAFYAITLTGSAMTIALLMYFSKKKKQISK